MTHHQLVMVAFGVSYAVCQQLSHVPVGLKQLHVGVVQVLSVKKEGFVVLCI